MLQLAAAALVGQGAKRKDPFGGPLFDFDKASRPNRETRKVNVDMPEWMIEALDEEAGRLSVNRQAVIKFWLSDRIDEERSKRAV